APIICLSTETAGDASLDMLGADPGTVEFPSLPWLYLRRPTIPQRFHVELWVEKSTMNDVLAPLAQRYGVNLITGEGELSATACYRLIERAKQGGKPIRILYLSDFDPAGDTMPV